MATENEKPGMSPHDNFSYFFVQADELMSGLRAALDGSKSGRIDAWRAEVISELRAVIEDDRFPKPAMAAGLPSEVAETPENSALHYRIASEISRHYLFRSTEDDAAALSRGMLLDLWDMWWRAAGNAKPGEEARRPEQLFPTPRKGEGRIVEPALIRDAFSECDNDVAWLLTDAGKHACDDASTDEEEKVPEDQELGVEGRLERQIGWQLRRLCQWDEPFGEPDRAVLYELLRLHHILLADGDTGLPADSVERLVDDAKRFGDSIRKFGDTSLPRISDAIFVNGAMESTEHLEQCAKIADALLVMFAQSSRGSDRNLRKLPEWLQEAGRAYGFLDDVDNDGNAGASVDEFDSIVRRMLLFWATRSRILRDALHDLLGYRFPSLGKERTEKGPPPSPQSGPGTGCDCWISVIGHRRAGKTSFMNALTAALLPDGSNLDGKRKSDDFWSKSKARLLMTSAFSGARTRTEAIQKSKDLEEGLLGPWLRGRKQPPTTTDARNMIDVDTGFLARIRFFDLAGEHMYDDEIGDPDIYVKKMLEDRRPVATIIVDDNDPARTRKEERGGNDESPQNSEEGLRESDRGKYLDLVHDPSAPIYIIVNKCDYFLDSYVGDAEREMRESLSYTYAHPPGDYDVAHEARVIPFFSLRDLDLSVDSVDHQTVIERLQDIPSLVRRPHYFQRVVEDVTRLDWLFDGLIRRGAHDITLVHLVLKRDGRSRPEEFSGLRVFWKEIETRLVERTKNERRRALRSLLVDVPVEMEKRAKDAFDVFTGDWWNITGAGAGSVATQSGGVGSMGKKAKENIERYETEGSSDWADRSHDQAVTTLRAFCELLERLSRRSVGEGESIPMLARLMYKLDEIVLFLLERRRFHRKLRVGLDQLLVEMGIDPDLPLHEIGALASVQRASSEERNHVDSFAEQLDQTLVDLAKEKVDLNDVDRISEFKRLLGAVIQGSSREGGQEDARRGVEFDFREGAKRPFGSSAGSPLLDGSLALDERDRLKEVVERGDRTVREAIFSAANGSERDLLVSSFYNLVQSQQVQKATRYPELTLCRGELDFCRVRVLSDPMVGLARLAGEYRKKSLELASTLLEANSENQRFDDNVVANAAIAEAIHGVMGDIQLKSTDELIREEEGEEPAVEKVKGLEGALSEWMARRYLFKIGKKRQELQDVFKDHQDFWKAIDSPSAQALTSGQRVVGRWRLHCALARISIWRGLINEFQRAVTVVHDSEDGRDGNNGNGFATRLLEDRSRTVLGNARKVLHTESTVPWKLIELRILRRLMIGGYVVRYLLATDWIKTACDAAARDGNTEIEQELRKARGALERMSLRFDDACASAEDHRNMTMGDDIGSPNFDQLVVKRDESVVRLDDSDDNWRALVDALGLDQEETELHPLWGDCR